MSDPLSESNPFQPGRPLGEVDQFVGREPELLFLFQQIMKQQPASVIGGDRVGKTWLLRYLMDESVQRRYLSQDQTCILLYAGASSGLRSAEDLIQYVLNGVRQRIPQIKFRDRGSLQRQLYDSLDSVAPWRLVLILDDFESMARDCDFPLEFYTFLRLIASDRDVSFIVATRRELHYCLPQQVISSPFANIFTVARLGPFGEDDFESFIAWGADRSGLPMHRWARTLDEITGRFPYLLQLAGYHYFEAWFKGGGSEAEREQMALQRYAQAARPCLAAMWAGLSPEAQSVLRQIAAEGTMPESREVERLEVQGYIRKQQPFSPLFADLVRGMAG